MKFRNITIAILNWNGFEFLQKCIPSIVKAVNVYGNNCEIVVIDNGSSDDSIGYLKFNFPKVNIISLKENLGFAKAMNIGIKEANSDIVIALNNDVIVQEDFILPLVSHFYKDGNIFAVAAKMLLWDRKTLNFGRAIGKFKFGVFRRTFQEPTIPTNTLYACGGAFAVDKDKFLKLGGFDEDMIYWEDIDLCYRAWKQGYKTIYEPRSIVYHKFHGSYIRKCGENGIRAISGENYFLFAIKNFHDSTLFYQQIFSLPLLVLISPLLGKSHFGLGLMRSLSRWALFLEKRREERKKAIFSDREVLYMSNQ
jgi:GT2 family glycosyltransferase